MLLAELMEQDAAADEDVMMIGALADDGNREQNNDTLTWNCLKLRLDTRKLRKFDLNKCKIVMFNYFLF